VLGASSVNRNSYDESVTPENAQTFSVGIRSRAVNGIKYPLTICLKQELGVQSIVDGLESNVAKCSQVLCPSTQVSPAVLASLKTGSSAAQSGESAFHVISAHPSGSVTDNDPPLLRSPMLHLDEDAFLMFIFH
jgi:hypothetical protein